MNLFAPKTRLVARTTVPPLATRAETGAGQGSPAARGSLRFLVLLHRRANDNVPGVGTFSAQSNQHHSVMNLITDVSQQRSRESRMKEVLADTCRMKIGLERTILCFLHR